MADPTTVLENSIRDVGLWSWWTAKLPDGVQVEFAGVQLYTDPPDPDSPPPGQVALQFGGPKFIAFLNGPEQSSDLPSDWPDQLQNDGLQPFTIVNEDFTTSSAEKLQSIVARAASQNVLFGEPSVLESLTPNDALLAFWAAAGQVGMVIVAQAMRPRTHQGPLSPSDVEAKHAKWWEYWKEYWARKDSSNPMPKDYACEVTLPVEEFYKMPKSIFEKHTE